MPEMKYNNNISEKEEEEKAVVGASSLTSVNSNHSDNNESHIHNHNNRDWLQKTTVVADNNNVNDEEVPVVHDDSVFIIDNANVIIQSDSKAHVEIDMNIKVTSTSDYQDDDDDKKESFIETENNVLSNGDEEEEVLQNQNRFNNSSVVQVDDSNCDTILQSDSKAQVEVRVVKIIKTNISTDITTASCQEEGEDYSTFDEVEVVDEEEGFKSSTSTIKVPVVDNDTGSNTESSNNSNNNSDNNNIPTFTKRWSNMIYKIQKPIEILLVNISMIAAYHPYMYMCVIISIIIALTLSGVGLLTNFHIEDRESVLWSPKGSLPHIHRNWIDNEFNGHTIGTDDIDSTYYFLVMIHANGDNVITMEGMNRTFEMLNYVRDMDGYNDFCSTYGTTYPCPTTDKYNAEPICELFGIPTGKNISKKVCDIYGPTGFWLHNTTVYNKQVTNDIDVQVRMSIDKLPGQKERVDVTNFIGFPEYSDNNNDTTMMTYAKSFNTYIYFPRYENNNTNIAEEIERDATERILELQKQWDDDINNIYKIELIATRSFEDEFNRGINNDMFLLPLVGMIMSLFTFIVFWKYNWLYSRSTLGLGATACVTISIMTGYGLLFCIGIPFNSLSQAAILIVYGVGLDDSFIIFNAYERNVHIDNTIERIRVTMQEVSVSIFMTTATSVCAFVLGCLSPVAAIQWLCIYAATTIGIDFIYQVTFFIALIALDEIRIANRRRDVLIWLKVPDGYNNSGQDAGPEVGNQQTEVESNEGGEGNTAKPHISVRVMSAYADILLKPAVKAVVLAGFISLLGYFAHRATMLELQFSFTDILPKDSYLTRFTEAMLVYSERRGASPFIYFRYVDQSKPEIRLQMEEYVNDLVGIDSITKQPFHFWVRDYDVYVNENKEFLHGLPFNETLWFFLRDFENDYSSSLVVDDNFNILYSRTQVHMDNVSMIDMDDILNALSQQREVTELQPINNQDGGGGGDRNFFTFDPVFQLWEFIAITEDQIVQSTIYGMVAVSVMSVIFLPHWSGILFVAPLMAVLYTDLLGVFQVAGIYVNGLTYVCMVLSIGLLVDFLMHVALRYFESTKSGRNAKVKDVLQTMGASVLLGGLSTFLGILPLVLSSSEVINTIFVTFVGIVTLGLGHGLILLPVILSVVGPT